MFTPDDVEADLAIMYEDGVGFEGAIAYHRLTTEMALTALLLLEREMNKYRVRVEKQFHTIPEAYVNGNQIQQVLLNLLINARQAMPSGGRLWIKLSHDEAAETVAAEEAEAAEAEAEEAEASEAEAEEAAEEAARGDPQESTQGPKSGAFHRNSRVHRSTDRAWAAFRDRSRLRRATLRRGGSSNAQAARRPHT